MLDDCHYSCEICGDPVKLEGNRGEGAYLDHNHDTGVVRGILCCDCNLTLGKMNDDPEKLESAAKYLRDRR